MLNTHALRASTALASLAFFVGFSPLATAQSESDDEDVEEVVVTGTFIRGRSQATSASPLAITDRAQFDAIGAKTIADLTQTLTINTGAQNNPDAFTQNLTTGTTNINLRGLGVQSTLILLNGKRNPLSGAFTNDGLNFVDTSSLIPSIAIQRQEILKDGAAALYGSDAVAGVVNFITRNDFEGLELFSSYQTVAGGDNGGRSEELQLEAIAGAQGDNYSIIAAFSYFDRTALQTSERRFSEPFGFAQDVSLNGQPGTFLPLVTDPASGFTDPVAAGILPTAPGVIGSTLVPLGPGGAAVPINSALVAGGSPTLVDPDCPAVANDEFPNSLISPPGGLPVCSLDFGDFFTLLPQEIRYQGYASGSVDLTETMEFYGEFSFSSNDVTRNNTPSFPNLVTDVVLGDAGLAILDPDVRAATPANPFNPFGVDVATFARPLGMGAASPSTHDSETFRVLAGLKGDLGAGYTFDISYIRGQNDFTTKVVDILGAEYSAALAGFGGVDCPPLTENQVPGAAGCQFFNPFGSAVTQVGETTINPATGEQVPFANDPAVIAEFTDTGIFDIGSNLTVVDAVISGDTAEFFEVPTSGQPIGLAFGFQYRNEEYLFNGSDNLNEGAFNFITGPGLPVPDFGTARDIFAGFVEISLPVLDWLEIQAAFRTENTEGTGTSTDPKVAVLASPLDNLQIRGSYSTSFRAPSIFQLESQGLVALSQLSDGLPVVSGLSDSPTVSFVGVAAAGNPDLEPETSRAFNVGVSYEPIERLNLSLDYYNFDFENIIVQDNPQAILDAAFGASVAAGSAAPLLDPNQFLRTSVGGLLTNVFTEFVNADSLETSGIDFAADYTLETGFGNFRPFFEGTYIIDYDVVDPVLGAIDGAGSRNFTNIGAPTPELRFNTGVSWFWENHSINTFVRYIDGFANDQVCVGAPTANGLELSVSGACPSAASGASFEQIEADLRLDVQYNYEIPPLGGDWDGAVLTVGAINVTDEDPPFATTNTGFATRVHDPRGRLFYARLKFRF